MSIDSLEVENLRLKEYIDTRSREVEDLAAKNIKQKAHFEDTISILKKENETIRLKMLEGERYSELEIENLNKKMHDMHELQIEEMKTNHIRYVDCLQIELKKMEGALRTKN